MNLIEWELALTEAKEQELRETLEKEEPEMGKRYVTSWERMAMKKGMQETLRTNISEVLEIRFGSAPAEVVANLQEIGDLEACRNCTGKQSNANR